MVPIQTAIFMVATAVCADAILGRMYTIREAKGVVRHLQQKAFDSVNALCRGVIDEARMCELEPNAFLQGVLQQARKHGVSFAINNEGNKDGQHQVDAHSKE